MKHMIIALGLMCSLLAAEPPKEAPKPPQGVPAGATPGPDGTWRHTDSKGKTWIYARTPFGISRSAEPAKQSGADTPAPQEKTASAAFRVVSVKGDLVTLEFGTPFGKSVTTKKKSELDAKERSALEQFETTAQAEKK